MHQHAVLQRFYWLLTLLCLIQYAAAQPCIGSQWIKNYNGSETQANVKSLFTTSKNLLTLGNIQYQNNNIVHNDGWVSLFTTSGFPIFSKRYSVPGYDLLQFNDIVAATDSTYLITGTIQTYWGVRDPAPLNLNWGVLISMDGYGNILWIKKMDQSFDAATESSFLQNIIKTSDGDFIMNAIVWKKPPFSSRGLLLRTDKNGNLKWLSSYSSPVFEFRYTFVNQIIQSADGKKIIKAGIIDERFKNKDSIVRVNHYLLSVDYATGQKIWDKSLNIRKQFSNVFTNYQAIRHISELSTGDFSFLGFGDTSFLSIPPLTTRAINIITNSNGSIKKMIGYSSANKGANIIDAVSLGADHQVLLLNDDTKAMVSEIDSEGNIVSEKGLLAMNQGQQPTNLLMGLGGLYLPMNGGQHNSYIYKTDASANIDCVTATASLQTSDASLFLSQDDAEMTVTQEPINGSLFSISNISQTNYPLTINNVCLNSCCKDILDTANTTTKTVCEKDHYLLPNGVPVTVSGLYFITNKTMMGCDSISYYNINIIKDPSALTLGADTCIEGKDSLVLIATPGYDRYSWNTFFTFQNQFTVTQSGTYQVTVNNQCGIKTADINVLAICDAPLYIPNAFTPNADGLNEVFRIPPTNFYRLNSFQIYNRWGELIFSTSDIKQGWDGNYKGLQQPTGIYTYAINIASLKTGKTSQRNGSVQLIR